MWKIRFALGTIVYLLGCQLPFVNNGGCGQRTNVESGSRTRYCVRGTLPQCENLDNKYRNSLYKKIKINQNTYIVIASLHTKMHVNLQRNSRL